MGARTAEFQPETHDVSAAEGRRSLARLLAGLQDALQALFDQRPTTQGRRRSIVQRRLLLGLELMWKIEDQVLLPALHDGNLESAPEVAAARRELELMRDLASLVGKTVSANRDTALRVLQGMASLHFDRLRSLLAADLAAGNERPWAELELEVRGLLGRWREEVLAHGDIEDEDLDPVGLPPR